MSAKGKAKLLAEDNEEQAALSLLAPAPSAVENATASRASSSGAASPNGEQWARDKDGDLDWTYTAKCVSRWSHDELLSHLYEQAFSIPARDYNPSAPFVYVRMTDGDGVSLPHGYRLPLLFVGRYIWAMIRATLKDERVWKSQRTNVLHLSRLCQNLFGRARVKAMKGGMEKGWRCLTFDRLLARFYKHWADNDPQSGAKFLSDYGAKEYDRDVLKHDWKRWCLRGLNSIKLTEDDVVNGMTVKQFRRTLEKNESTGTWSIDSQPLSFITSEETQGGSWSSTSELTDWDMDDAEEEIEDKKPIISEPAAKLTPSSTPTKRSRMDSNTDTPTPKRVKVSNVLPLMSRTLAAISKNPAFSSATSPKAAAPSTSTAPVPLMSTLASMQALFDETFAAVPGTSAFTPSSTKSPQRPSTTTTTTTTPKTTPKRRPRAKITAPASDPSARPKSGGTRHSTRTIKPSVPWQYATTPLASGTSRGSAMAVGSGGKRKKRKGYEFVSCSESESESDSSGSDSSMEVSSVRNVTTYVGERRKQLKVTVKKESAPTALPSTSSSTATVVGAGSGIGGSSSSVKASSGTSLAVSNDFIDLTLDDSAPTSPDAHANVPLPLIGSSSNQNHLQPGEGTATSPKASEGQKEKERIAAGSAQHHEEEEQMAGCSTQEQEEKEHRQPTSTNTTTSLTTAISAPEPIPPTAPSAPRLRLGLEQHRPEASSGTMTVGPSPAFSAPQHTSPSLGPQAVIVQVAATTVDLNSPPLDEVPSARSGDDAHRPGSGSGSKTLTTRTEQGGTQLDKVWEMGTEVGASSGGVSIFHEDGKGDDVRIGVEDGSSEQVEPPLAKERSTSLDEVSCTAESIAQKAFKLVVDLMEKEGLTSLATEPPSAQAASVASSSDFTGKLSSNIESQMNNFEGRFLTFKEELADIAGRLQALEKESREGQQRERENKEREARTRRDREERERLERAGFIRSRARTEVEVGTQTDTASLGTGAIAMHRMQTNEDVEMDDAGVNISEKVQVEVDVQTRSIVGPEKVTEVGGDKEVSTAEQQQPASTSTQLHISEDATPDCRAEEMRDNLSLLVDNLVSAKMLTIMQTIAKPSPLKHSDSLSGTGTDTPTRVGSPPASVGPLFSQSTLPTPDGFLLGNLLEELRIMREEAGAREQRDKEEMHAMRQLHTAEVDALRQRLSYLESHSRSLSYPRHHSISNRYDNHSGENDVASRSVSASNSLSPLLRASSSNPTDGGRQPEQTPGSGRLVGKGGSSNGVGTMQLLPTPTPSERNYRLGPMDGDDDVPLPIKSQRKQYFMGFGRAHLG